MSDFDKEAEREKLREKYGDDDEQDATERMSELLLKGATMTNAHCGTCNDPIFRYEGQEFCPTCQEVIADETADADAEVDTAGNGETADAERTDTAATPGTTTESTPSTTEPAAQTTEPADAPPTSDTDSTPQNTSTAEQSSTPAETAAQADSDSHRVPSAAPAGTDSTTAEDVSSAPEMQGRTDTSLSTARASLSRTVTQLARQAEACDDLERARAYLAATEEAADALAAVKQADR